MLESSLEYDPVNTTAVRRAAEFQPLLRQLGISTADPDALDGDCILATQASILGGNDDPVTIATTNVGHLRHFPGIDARLWSEINLNSPDA